MGRQNNEKNKAFGVYAVSQRSTHHSAWLYMQQQKLPAEESAKRNPTWTYCDECFFPCREILSGHRHDEKTGRKVGLRPAGKSAVCLAWMVLPLVSLFHKINWVNVFNLKEWVVQTRFCSTAFANMVKGNLKKLHCEDSKDKSTIGNNQKLLSVVIIWMLHIYMYVHTSKLPLV